MSTYSDHDQRMLDQQSGAELDRQAQRREAKTSNQYVNPRTRDVPAKITEYLSNGGLFNPELMDHEAVRDLLIHARDVIEIFERERSAGETPVARSFQDRVFDWARDCFGEHDTTSREMRTDRFLEEALEMGQACGCDEERALRILRYVYGRPRGEVAQEAGGTMVSLAVLCQAFGIGMSMAGENELHRVLGKIEHIRARHAAKPDFAIPAVKTGSALTISKEPQ